MITLRSSLAIAALALAAAACGETSGPSGDPRSITITTPTGGQYVVVPIDYTLVDPAGTSASVAVEYSVNGGSTWSTATRVAAKGEGTTALATSAAGTKHTFYWDARADGVGITGEVSTVRVRITRTDGAAGVVATTPSFAVDSDLQQVIGVATNIFSRDGTNERTSEIALGNLITDAMRLRAETQLAVMNGGAIRAPLPSPFVATTPGLRRAGAPPYDLVGGDVWTVLPFADRMATTTITGAQLWAALERSISALPAASGGFLQISGFRFTYDPGAAAGSRVRSVTLNSGAAIAANATTYTIAMPDFLAAGGSGYVEFTGGTTPVLREVVANVVGEYIANAGTVTPATSGRITVAP